MSITDWITPRPTGATYRPTNTTTTTHQRHHLDIQDTIYNVHTDAHSTPNTYFQHTMHTIYAQLSNHGIASHTQYTLYNVHAQQSNLGNTRSPVTSRPLNGHFAIILFPLTHWRSRLAFFSKSLTFVNINIVHIIHHPGRFLGPPPGYTAWRWGTRAQCPVGRLELSAQGRLFLYMSL